MNKMIFLSIAVTALNAFSAVNLPAGGSAIVNGEVVTCAGGGSTGTGAVSCSCNGSWGAIGQVLVSAGLSPVDECRKLSSGSIPNDCKALTSETGYYKCDCNGSWGTIGQATVSPGVSAVEECRKLSSGSIPNNCKAL